MGGEEEFRWISEQGGLFATWKIRSSWLTSSPGIIQTSVGAIVSTVLKAEMWPNDILNKRERKWAAYLLNLRIQDSGIRIGIGLNRFAFSAENQLQPLDGKKL